MIDTILLLIAAACFGLEAINVKVGSVNLLALGLLAWVLTALL